MKMTKINTALATTGIVASMANGAPLNGGSQVEANAVNTAQGDWISLHPDREPYAVPTGLPVSRFPGGPRKGPCGKECDTMTSSAVDDEVSTTKLVIDPLNPTRPMGTPATTYTNIFTVSDETTKTSTAAAAQTQTTTSSEGDVRITPSGTYQRISVPNIVFVTTTSGVETSVSKTSEAGLMPTLLNPLLPPWDQPQPILSSADFTLPQPVLTTIIPKTTSSALPEPVLTTIHESTASHTISTQTQTSTETSVELATEFETVLATATQYVTPAPIEQTFITVTTTARKEDVNTVRRA